MQVCKQRDLENEQDLGEMNYTVQSLGEKELILEALHYILVFKYQKGN